MSAHDTNAVAPKRHWAYTLLPAAALGAATLLWPAPSHTAELEALRARAAPLRARQEAARAASKAAQLLDRGDDDLAWFEAVRDAGFLPPAEACELALLEAHIAELSAADGRDSR